NRRVPSRDGILLPETADRLPASHHGCAVRRPRAENHARRTLHKVSFLQPFAFWFAAIAPVIVLLYLLKVKRRPAVVSTLMFWLRVATETRRRALFQRLRQLLSLL